MQYRPEQVEKYDQIAYSKKSKNEELKKKILPSLFSVEESTETLAVQNVSTNKKNTKNKGLKNNTLPSLSSVEEDKETTDVKDAASSKKKNKHLKQKVTLNNAGSNCSEGELVTSEMVVETTLKNPNTLSKSKRNKRKKKKDGSAMSIKTSESNVELQNLDCSTEQSDESKSVKNKKKRKLSGDQAANPAKKFKKDRNVFNKNSNKTSVPSMNISDARLNAYGFNPKKFKNKIKYGKK